MTTNGTYGRSTARSYEDYHKKSTSVELPHNEEAWLGRARQVAELFNIDAVHRDVESKSPFAEVALLKSSGLLKVLGPKAFGGGGQSWEVGYRAIREVAKGDGCVIPVALGDCLLISGAVH